MTKATSWMGGWKLKIERKVGGGSKKRKWCRERIYLAHGANASTQWRWKCLCNFGKHPPPPPLPEQQTTNNKQRRKKKREGGKRERWVGSGRVEGWKVWSRRSAQTLLFLCRRLLFLCLSAYRFLSLSLYLFWFGLGFLLVVGHFDRIWSTPLVFVPIWPKIWP